MLKWSHGTDITNMGQINNYFLQCVYYVCLSCITMLILTD